MSIPADQKDAVVMVARLYLQYGFAAKAATLFKALSLLDPDEVSHRRSLALALFRSQRAQDALPVLDQLALKGEVDGGFHVLRAQVLAELGRTGEATASMQAYLSLQDPPPSPSRRSSPRLASPQGGQRTREATVQAGGSMTVPEAAS